MMAQKNTIIGSLALSERCPRCRSSLVLLRLLGDCVCGQSGLSIHHIVHVGARYAKYDDAGHFVPVEEQLGVLAAERPEALYGDGKTTVFLLLLLEYPI